MFMSPAAITKKPKINVNRIFVIIPAAGLSTRMESDVNKQIMEIDGVSVIERTLGAFQKFSDSLASSGVSLRAVVVTSEELVYRINGLCRYNKFEFVQQVVTGGKTRMESVWRGIEALADLPFPPGDNDIVFIHDGARCLVDQPTLERCLEGAMKYDICAAAVPVKSTIKQTKMDIFDEIPSVNKETPKKPGRKTVEEPVAPVAEEPVEPEEPANYLRAAFEDREPAAPSTPTFTSLTSLMESKKASEQSKIFAAREEAKEPSPFEAPRDEVDEDGYRMNKVFVSDNPVDSSSNKNPVLGLGMDYISKLPSLADRLGGAVMGKIAKEEQKRNAAAEEAAKKKKAEAPKAKKKTPYVRPDSPFKRIDINEITVDDDEEVEPEVVEEETKVEEEFNNSSPFKRIDTSKITVDDDDRPTTRPAARPPVTRPASAVRPAARPPVTRPASAVRPAARPATAAERQARNERPVPAGRPASRPGTAERANPAGRPAAVGRPGSSAAKSPFKNNNASPEVVSTPDRDELMEVQTPQVFRFDKLIQSYVNGIKHNIEATDDTSLAEAIHLKVHLVEGSYTNIKITTKEDIDYAEMILKRQATESAT